MPTTSYTVPSSSSVLGGRMTISDGTNTYSVPYAPKVTSLDVDINDWQEQTRPGRKPILVSGGRRLKRFQLSIRVADGNEIDSSVLSDINMLRVIANSEQPVKIEYGGDFTGQWRITSLSVNTEERTSGEDDPSRMTVDMEITEWVDVKGATSVLDVPKKTKITKKLDTCTKISIQFYKTSSYAAKIADANGIKDIQKSLKVGREIKLPRP